jgi:hypothetical protein
VKLLFVLACLALTFSLHCERLPIAGGTTDTGNARIAAVIYANDGARAKGASVIFRSKNYLSSIQNADFPGNSTQEKQTTTDDSGRFVIDSVEYGSYSIEVNDRLSSATLIQAKVSSAFGFDKLFSDTLRPYAGISGNIGLQTGSSSRMFVLVYGLERRIPIDSAGHYAIGDLPAGILNFRIMSQDTVFKPFDIPAVTLTQGSVDTVAFAGWRFSTTIMLNTSASGAAATIAVTNFPILVRLTKDNFNFSLSQGSGADLRFGKRGGAFFSFEIERFDSALQTAEVWVKVDTVHGNDSVQNFIMYYGNSAAPGGSDGRNVFDTAEGFQGVWHMNENPAGGANAIKDRTANGHDGTPSGSMGGGDVVRGMIGNALNFNGQNASISAGILNVSKSYTLSCWVNSNDLSSARRFIWKEFSYTLWYDAIGAGIRVEHFTNAGIWRGIYQDGGNLWPLTAGTWYYLVGTYDGNKIRYYLNGEPKDSTQAIGVNPNSSNQILSLGGRPGELVSGTMDEVRIENIARSADWIKLCYMNQKSDDQLVVVKNNGP